MTKPKRKTPRPNSTTVAPSVSSVILSSGEPSISGDADDASTVPKIEDTELDVDGESSGEQEKKAKPRSRASSSKKPVSGGGSRPPNSAASSKSTSKAAKMEEVEEEREGRSMRGRAGNGKKKVQEVPVEEEEEEDEEDEDEGGDGGEGITRCVCADDTEEMSSGLMIQCDTCKCWQHGPCVGLWGEKDCPDRYFCELCRPGWHGPGGLLRKAHRKPASTTPAPSHHRSPSASSSHAPRNKPRESADAALVAAFLAAEYSVHPNGHQAEREKSEMARSEGDKRSPSAPVLQPGEKAPKKRSTMNSRDAAYDDAIAMSILGPGSAAMRARLEKARGDGDRSMSNGGDEKDDSGDEGHERPRRSRSHSPVDEKHKHDPEGEESSHSHQSKRRKISPEPSVVQDVEEKEEQTKEDEAMDIDEPEVTAYANEVVETEETPVAVEESAATEASDATGEGLESDDRAASPPPAAAPVRAKHPNQYTYRPKNGPTAARAPRASPAKRSAVAPVEHAFRNQRPRDWTPLESGSWGLPDHLKHLHHLLPSALPTPLVVPTYSRPTPDATAPSTSDLPPPVRETRLEPHTRVRFPNKRMTMPEMKKRARNVLDYLARIQIEMSERERRSDAINHAVAGTSAGSSGHATPPMPLEVGTPAQVESMRMMDSLTKDVILFQQRYFGTSD